MSEERRLCQFRQASICCLPEGHVGSHFPVSVADQWMAMLNSIQYKEREIARLHEELEKLTPKQQEDHTDD